MSKSISLIFGEPVHGWLPINFKYLDFNLDFSASSVLNDPIEELYRALSSSNNTEPKRVTWWLEPGAYFFEFKKEKSSSSLTIIETENLHNANARKKQLIKISGDENEIIEPMRVALKQFSSKTYDEKHWP